MDPRVQRTSPCSSGIGQSVPEAVNSILARAENRGNELVAAMTRITNRLNAVPPQPESSGGQDAMPEGTMQQKADHIQNSLAVCLKLAETIETILF